jgi:hypothetical protein
MTHYIIIYVNQSTINFWYIKTASNWTRFHFVSFSAVTAWTLTLIMNMKYKQKIMLYDMKLLEGKGSKHEGGGGGYGDGGRGRSTTDPSFRSFVKLFLWICCVGRGSFALCNPIRKFEGLCSPGVFLHCSWRA